MINQSKRSWQAFCSSAPGMRFSDRHRRRQRDSHGRWTPASVAYIVVGLTLAAGGLLLVPAPGPGWLVTFFGLGLLGSEFGPLARVLDSAEIRLRVWGRAAVAVWQDASGRERAIIALVVGGLLLALGYGLVVLLM